MHKITALSVEIGGDNPGVVYINRGGRCRAYAATRASMARIAEAVGRDDRFRVHPARTGYYAQRQHGKEG